MSPLKQPAAGVLATAAVIAAALLFVSRFDFATFTGWVSYLLLCLIPTQIVGAVTWRADPEFAAAFTQPLKGVVLTLATFGIGVLVAVICFATIGGRVAPPTPMLMMCSIVSVVVTFWATIIWGGWPFTTLIKQQVAAGLVLLGGCYLVNYILFRVFFDYGFMSSAPVYVAAQDPHGLFGAWYALVFYLSCLSAMFFLVNFDLWPLTRFPRIMRQPALGALWTVIAVALGGLVFFVGVRGLGMDPVAFMVRVPVPFIFGTIVIQNMLKGSLFGAWAQPGKGVLNVAAVVVIGTLLSLMYGALAPAVTGPISAGPPTYDFEIWLATALLSVTFPFLIFYSEFFRFWPLAEPRA